LPCAAKVTLRDQLREARERAINDAEAYDELLSTFERLGCVLSGKVKTLGAYREHILSLCEKSPLATVVPKQHRDWHIPASVLYELVRNARNDALHQGAFARHLTTHAIQLEIILEDALMREATQVGDFMVRDPVCAQFWQPLSFIRQQMLTNSFSYLPVLYEGKWCLVSDQSVARYLRANVQERDSRLAKTLQAAMESDGSLLEEATCSHADVPINDVLLSCSQPILVCRRDEPKDLVGILTAFDLL